MPHSCAHCIPPLRLRLCSRLGVVCRESGSDHIAVWRPQTGHLWRVLRGDKSVEEPRRQDQVPYGSSEQIKAHYCGGTFTATLLRAFPGWCWTKPIRSRPSNWWECTVPWCGHWGRSSTPRRYSWPRMCVWECSTTFGKLGIKSFCVCQVIRVYIGSFWSHPLLIPDNRKLFEAEEQDLFKDIQSLPRNAALRKLNDLIKRARLAKVGSGRSTKTLGWRLSPELYYCTYVKLI